MAITATNPQEGSRVARFTVSVPTRQNEALDDLVRTTGFGKNELIRQAIGLLAIAVTARDKGLVMALANEDDEVLTRIVSTL